MIIILQKLYSYLTAATRELFVTDLSIVIKCLSAVKHGNSQDSLMIELSDHKLLIIWVFYKLKMTNCAIYNFIFIIVHGVYQ